MPHLPYISDEPDDNVHFSPKELRRFNVPDEHGVYPSANELRRRAWKARKDTEDQIYNNYPPYNESPTHNACPICSGNTYCYCGYSQSNSDYDRMDDSCEYCPDCGTHGLREVYYISDNRAVCACSPLYPDLRPSDYPHKPCTCDLAKYEYLGETICICISPDLYALLERQHELHLTLNIRRLSATVNDIPF